MAYKPSRKHDEPDIEPIDMDSAEESIAEGMDALDRILDEVNDI